MTHTSAMTEKHRSALRQFADGARLHHNTIRSLIRAGLLKQGPKGYVLTPLGHSVLGSSYVIEQRAFDKWTLVRDESGGVLQFASPDAAGQHAARLSIMTSERLRVVREGDAPDSFPVFVFGQRFIEDAASGAQTPVLPPAIDDDDEVPIAAEYVVVRRADSGWTLAGARRYADVELATAAAARASRTSDDDFAALPDVALDLPVIVCYRKGERVVNVGVLNLLIDAVLDCAPVLPVSDTLAARQQVALGWLLAQWAERTPTTVVAVCVEALRALDMPALADTVAQLQES